MLHYMGAISVSTMVLTAAVFVLGICNTIAFSPARTSANVKRDARYPGGFCPLMALSKYLENDLVAVRIREDDAPRLCAVKPDGGVAPLCIREDDVETDLFADPREFSNGAWDDVVEDNVAGEFGEGFYGQRPVPSLGGGPGYGADALEIWSVTEEVLDEVRQKGIELPVLDVGIAHGEKARGGSF